MPGEACQLGKARSGEGNRPWSGGPGTAALATGLVETAWVLRAVRQRCPDAVAYLDWDKFAAAGVGLFLWEAFVTGAAKAATHTDDALIAAATFRDALPTPAAASAVTAERPMSLLGAAMLWSGWSTDLEVLRAPCLVIKTSPPALAVGPPGHTYKNSREFEAPQGETASRRADNAPTRERLIAKAEQIPAGSWTTYGDIAKMIDSHPNAVGAILRAISIPNAHRILNVNGEVSAGFAFPDERTDDPVDLLKAEGIRFTNGRADPRQRWHPQND